MSIAAALATFMHRLGPVEVGTRRTVRAKFRKNTRRDQARLVDARQRTAMEVMPGTRTRGALLLRGPRCAPSRRCWVAKAGAGAADPGADRDGGCSGGLRPCDHAARVPAVPKYGNVEVPQFLFIDRVPDIPVAT